MCGLSPKIAIPLAITAAVMGAPYIPGLTEGAVASGAGAGTTAFAGANGVAQATAPSFLSTWGPSIAAAGLGAAVTGAGQQMQYGAEDRAQAAKIRTMTDAVNESGLFDKKRAERTAQGFEPFTVDAQTDLRRQETDKHAAGLSSLMQQHRDGLDYLFPASGQTGGKVSEVYAADKDKAAKSATQEAIEKSGLFAQTLAPASAGLTNQMRDAATAEDIARISAEQRRRMNLAKLKAEAYGQVNPAQKAAGEALQGLGTSTMGAAAAQGLTNALKKGG